MNDCSSSKDHGHHDHQPGGMKMCDEWQTRDKEPDVDSDEPPHPDPDAKDDGSPPVPAIVPGNVGSLDDVPSDVLEEEMPTVDDEAT
jgi:hypothetical protein